MLAGHPVGYTYSKGTALPLPGCYRKEEIGMWVYSPRDDENLELSVEYPKKTSEFEIQSAVYERLKSRGFTVKGEVHASFPDDKRKAKCLFDLVVFKGEVPAVIIEIKDKDERSWARTRQGYRYRCFGLPVILFHDLSLLESLVSTVAIWVSDLV